MHEDVEGLKTALDDATTRLGLSVRKLVQLAAEAGHPVNPTTLYAIRAGTYTSTPSEKTVGAIRWIVSYADKPLVLPHPEPETLAQMLENAVVIHGEPLRRLATRAQSAGFKVTHTTLYNITAGTYKDPSSETVDAIRWLANRTPRDAGDFTLPHHDPASLADLVDNAAARHGLSSRQLAILAQEAGHTVTSTTLSNIRSGTYKSQPREETVRAIGWLAGVSDDEAFRAASMRPPGPPFADELPPGVDNLSPQARRVVIDLLRVLIASEEAARGDE